MRRALATWLLPSFVFAAGITITWFIYASNVDGTLSEFVTGFSFVVSGFVTAVFLNLSWWIPLGLLGAALHVTHRHRGV